LLMLVFIRGERRPVQQPPTPAPPAVSTPAPTPAPAPAIPAGDGQAPFGWPTGRPWNDAPNQRSTGYCPWMPGRGWTGELSWPVQDQDATAAAQTFRPAHKAIDIDVPMDTAVHAGASGVVVWAGADNHGGGLKVVLSHGDLWHTRYVHLDKATVSCGDFVAQGQAIGQSGQSGTSWPHLHFAVHQGNESHDPCRWLGCERN